MTTSTRTARRAAVAALPPSPDRCRILGSHRALLGEHVDAVVYPDPGCAGLQLADRDQTIYVEVARKIQKDAVDRLGFLFDE
jgi:hypothetical protein